MSEAPAAAVGGAIGRLPSAAAYRAEMPCTAKAFLEAQAVVRGGTHGPREFDNVPGMPGIWSDEDVLLPLARLRALLRSRGVISYKELPPKLMEFRRQLQKRGSKSKKRGSMDRCSVSRQMHTAKRTIVSATKLAAASATIREARDGPWWVHDGGRDLGVWSLAELQSDKQPWKELILARGIVGRTPDELRKLRKQMLGRLDAKKSYDKKAQEEAEAAAAAKAQALMELPGLVIVDLGSAPDSNAWTHDPLSGMDPDPLDDFLPSEGITNMITGLMDADGFLDSLMHDHVYE